MFYITLSIIGFVGKSLLFKQLLSQYNGSQLHKLLYSMFVLLIIQSGFELFMYTQTHKIGAAHVYGLLLGYYFCLIYAVALQPFIALATSNQRIPQILIYLTIGIIAVISIIMIFTQLIIADVRLIETTSSITRVPGPYYSVIQLLVVGCVFMTLAVLISKSFHENYFVRVRSRNLCLAFIPILLFTITIISAMSLGAEINAVGTLPVIVLIYLAAMMHNLHPDKQPDYCVFIPFSGKHKIMRNALNRLVYIDSDANKAQIEEQLIDYYLAQPGLKQKDVAKLLNISESKLSRHKKQLTNKDTD